jgi:bacterioferritin-associated ferredoxin
MILCSCNVLSDRDIRERLRKGDRPSVAGLFRQLGCEAKCGRCTRNILAVLEEHRGATNKCAGGGAREDCRVDEMAA